MDQDSADHPTKWPQVYQRFCQWWLHRHGQPFEPEKDMDHWETFLAGWAAAGRHGAH